MYYNHIVQAAVYNSIDAKLANFLHQKGFVKDNRSFKMFSISLLKGQFQMDKESRTITFSKELSFTVSSPVETFCQSLANTLLNKGIVRLGNENVVVEEVNVKKFVVEEEVVLLRTLSPVVTYSTLLRLDGRKYTCYFQPGEPDYNRLINANLQKKYRAYYNSGPPEGEVEVKAVGPQKMNLVIFKDTVIKGYSGKLKLSGPVPLLQLGVDSGIGGKNAQGFGCVEIL